MRERGERADEHGDRVRGEERRMKHPSIGGEQQRAEDEGSGMRVWMCVYEVHVQHSGAHTHASALPQQHAERALWGIRKSRLRREDTV